MNPSNAGTNDARLTQLVVGKTLTIRNTVAGQRYEISYGQSGRRLILSVDGKQPEPGEVWDVTGASAMGSPAPYEIKGGQVITTIGEAPFAVTVYKLGEKYLAARSNEFGYANYELEKVQDSNH